MEKRYKVTLTSDERQELLGLVSNGKSNTQKIKHANILLAVDEVENALLDQPGGGQTVSLSCQYGGQHS